MNKNFLLPLAAACALAFAGSAGAAISKDEYKAQKDQAQAAYKADKERCKPMKGNAADICKAEAKGKYEVAKAELEAQYKPSAKADEKAREAKAKADYEVAKEKCDDLKGNAKDVCVKDAKAAYTTAKGQAKVAKADGEKGVNSGAAQDARQDAKNDSNDAKFAAAKERCDAMSGDKKDACVNDAKKKFGKM
jgi:hypothetical protein